jgi:hypothetical protein
VRPARTPRDLRVRDRGPGRLQGPEHERHHQPVGAAERELGEREPQARQAIGGAADLQRTRAQPRRRQIGDDRRPRERAEAARGRRRDDQPSASADGSRTSIAPSTVRHPHQFVTIEQAAIAAIRSGAMPCRE